MEYLYTLVYEALELLSQQKNTNKTLKNQTIQAERPLEYNKSNEFLLLDDMIEEGKRISLSPRKNIQLVIEKVKIEF